MKISLFQGIVFGVFGLAALIGVFVFATHTGRTGGTAAAIGSVVIWGTLPKADIANTLTALAQADASFKEVSYLQKNQDTLPSDLASAIATGNMPDLVLASQEQLPSLTKFVNVIPSATLSQAAFTNAFISEGSLFAVPDGSGYYGIPFLVDPLVLYSNRAILASSGIAKPPVTWEALTGLVPTVAVTTPSKQVTRGLIALGTYDNVHNARGILSALFLQTGVPISSYSTDNSLVANLGDVTGLSAAGQAVLNFYTQFADPTKVSYTWNASLKDSQQAFLAGDTALYLGFSSEAKYLSSANPNLDFVVSPLPQPATASLKSAYGLTYAFLIPRGAKNSSGAYQVAVLFSGNTSQATAASLTGLAPTSLNALSTQPSDPREAVAYAEALYTKGWLSPAPADTDKVFSGMITSVISGRQTPATALTASASSISALLQK